MFSAGIKNPVLVARRLLSEAQKGKLSAGRIPPWWWVQSVLFSSVYVSLALSLSLCTLDWHIANAQRRQRSRSVPGISQDPAVKWNYMVLKSLYVRFFFFLSSSLFSGVCLHRPSLTLRVSVTLKYVPRSHSSHTHASLCHLRHPINPLSLCAIWSLNVSKCLKWL